MKTFLLLFLSLFCFGGVAHADIFELHLRYDAEKNRIDFLDDQHTVSVNKNKSISIVDFSEESSAGPFEFAFFDANDDELERKQFVPKQGSFVIEVPYYSIATKVVIRRSGSLEPLITHDIVNLSTCNNNKICEFEKGETFDTCLPDCDSNAVTYSPETQAKLDASGGVLRDPKTGAILLNIVKPEPTPVVVPETQNTQSQKKLFWNITLLVVGVLILIGGVVWFIRQREE